MKFTNTVAWLVLLLLISATVHAQSLWTDLSTEQQNILKPYEAQWAELPIERQRKILKGIDRLTSLDDTERKNAQERFRHWQALSNEKKQQIRERYQLFRALPLAERQKLRLRYQQFRELPTERRRELRRQWKNISPERRRRLLNRHRRN